MTVKTLAIGVTSLWLGLGAGALMADTSQAFGQADGSLLLAASGDGVSVGVGGEAETSANSGIAGGTSARADGGASLKAETEAHAESEARVGQAGDEAEWRLKQGQEKARQALEAGGEAAGDVAGAVGGLGVSGSAEGQAGLN